MCCPVAEGLPAAREGKLQSIGNFQISASVTFTDIPLAKQSHIGSSAWVQRGVIYWGHNCNDSTQHVLNYHSNPAVPKLSVVSWDTTVNSQYCGAFRNFQGNLFILHDHQTSCKQWARCRSWCQHHNDTFLLVLLYLCKAGFSVVAVIKSTTWKLLWNRE